MNQSHFKTIVAVLTLLGLFSTATQICLAGDGAACCGNDCSNGWSNGRVSQCYDHCYIACERICQFRLVDDGTKCAWSRTWNAPNAFETPLRRYYVPRPPQCSWYDDCAANYGAAATSDTPVDTNCQKGMCVASSDISPQAAAGFSPPQFERLGKLRNELDVVGPIGAPASARPAAPAR